MEEIAKVGAYIIVSVGGAGALIVALGKWYGGFLANILLEGEKAHHRQELEQLKSELEATNRKYQAELDKTIHVHQVQFEKEFQALSDIWEKATEVRLTMQILRPELGFEEGVFQDSLPYTFHGP